MYPVSAAFLEAITESHVAVVRAECWLGGAMLAEIPIATGSVSVDSRRSALRTCTLEVSPDGDRDLEELYAILGQFGAELKLYRGVRLSSGDELVPLGVFVITEADFNEFAPSLAIAGTDRSLRITRARWTNPYTIAAGTLVADAISALLHDRWSGCLVGFDNTDTGNAAIGAPVVLDAGDTSDPWKDAQTIVSAHGLDLYFDGDGVAQIRQVPDVSSSPATIVYGTGSAAVVIDKKRRWTYEQTYTGVIATGEGSGVATPVRGEAWDDDPASPTYYLGPVGKIPYYYSSPLITTAAQASSAARTMLSRVVGRIEQVDWAQIVNPAHDGLDVVGLTDASGAVQRFILDAFTIPLSISEGMAATARETRTRT